MTPFVRAALPGPPSPAKPGGPAVSQRGSRVGVGGSTPRLRSAASQVLQVHDGACARLRTLRWWSTGGRGSARNGRAAASGAGLRDTDTRVRMCSHSLGCGGGGEVPSTSGDFVPRGDNDAQKFNEGCPDSRGSRNQNLTDGFGRRLAESGAERRECRETHAKVA